MSCHWVDSCVIDKDHGQILTGGLKITNKNKLRETFTRQPRYIESMSLNVKETRSDLIASLNTCIDNWCTERGIQKFNLREVKQNVLKLLDDDISERHLHSQNTVLLQF